MIDESPDALLAVSLDGRIVSWNRGATALFGYTAEEPIGRSLATLARCSGLCDQPRRQVGA